MTAAGGFVRVDAVVASKIAERNVSLIDDFDKPGVPLRGEMSTRSPSRRENKER